MPISLYINGVATESSPGLTLFDLAERIGVRVPTSCRKNGKCKECIVEVTEGPELLTTPTEYESHLRQGFRLSCQCLPQGESGSVRCHTMRRGQMRVESGGLNLPDAVRKTRLAPAVTRDGTRVLIDGAPVADWDGPVHGLAVDIGTTTVVARLMNLETGDLIADAAFENPQRFGGAEVMSRIHYDCEQPGGLLMRTLAGYLKHAIEDFPVDPRSIFEVVVVGNSTMRDIFFRQNVYTIGQNPYQSITEIELAQGKRTTTSLVQTAKRALLPLNDAARVYGAPIMSGHLGADAAACMLAVDLANEERLVCVMDIGTNTELILGNKRRILAASCPAGPAFEGGAIACGMPGLDGAIERVAARENDNGDLEFDVTVIGDGPAKGICGSGLIDVMSELLRLERMNAMGRFEDGADRFVLAHSPEDAAGVYFTESDVNELAQAKGANVAGLQAVCNCYGVSFNDIDVFYLAGGFGRRLSIDAARRIGLIPDIPDAKIVQVGNAAVEGATIALLSAAKRAELEGLVRRTEHVRLETHPDFFDYFVEGCQFKPVQNPSGVTT